LFVSRCRALAVLVFCLAAGAFALAGNESAGAASANCRGLATTVPPGSDGPDMITGTPERDVIQANGGNDTVCGLGGGVLICGGPGDDRLGGGDSFDALDGQDGNDTLLGGDAGDVLFGGPGDDPQLDGGLGFDVAYGDDGVDACTANERNYRCEGVVRGADAEVPIELPKALPCDYLASPTGDDAGAGSFTDPFLTVERLVNSLEPGETGCLEPGAEFTEPDQEILVRAQGQRGKPVVLRTTPTPGGRQATIRGRLWFCKDTDFYDCTADDRGSHDVEFRDVMLDGRNSLATAQADPRFETLPSPTVNGDRITFTHVEVSNSNTGPCFAIGSVNGYGIAVDTLIRGRSRIHNCGRVAQGQLDLPISLEASRNAVIKDSLIYDNYDTGIYVYADAQDSRIQNNVIDGNGRALAFDPYGPNHPEGTEVTGNVISNSRLSYPEPVGSDHWQVEGGFNGSPPWNNRVTGNCLFEKAGRNFYPAQTAFTAYGNTFAPPGYEDRVKFRLRGGEGECPVSFGPQEEAPPPVEPPLAARSFNVRPGKGRSGRFVRVKRTRVVTRDQRGFLPLVAKAQIPVGSTLDATKRPVKLTVAIARRPKGVPPPTRTLTLSRGRVVARQTRGRRPITDLILPLYRRSKSRSSGRAHAAGLGSGARFKAKRCRCRVKGRHAVASRPRSDILVENRRRGTFVRVYQGRVTVFDCVRRRKLTVRAGHSYLARPRGRRHC
jgi:parallel beta-helix repeat protein